MTNSNLTSVTAEHDTGPREGVVSRSFLGLLLTQFLGAMNDNIFRWLIVPIGKAMVPPEQHGAVLAAGLVMLVSPFIFFAAPAGYLADRFSKQRVIVGCKVLEIVVMLLGVVAILSGSILFMFAVLFLMGAQSALFGPSKYGAIPELVRPDRIPMANGLVGMTTIIAIIAGTLVGGLLFDFTMKLPAAASAAGAAKIDLSLWWVSALVIVGVATLGTITSLLIHPLEAAAPRRPVPLNPLGETWNDFRRLAAARPLLLAALGSALFWSLAGLCQVTIDRVVTQDLALDQTRSSGLQAMMALGVGLGNVTAGLISAGRIELGLVPLSGAGLALGAMAMFLIPGAAGEAASSGFIPAALLLLVMGFFAGAYEVPLASFLQYRSPKENRGSILAACNFLTFSGTLVAAGIFWLLADILQLSGREIFLAAGVAVLPAVLLTFWLIPADALAFVLRIVMRLTYRVRVEGKENIPTEGPALLVCNHVSWIDGPVLGLVSPRRPRMVVYAQYFDRGVLKWFGRIARVIPIRPGRRSIVDSIRQCRAALEAGEIVGIFPEGGLTRDGQMQPFQQGFLSILNGSDVPLLPVAIDGLWGSIFSFEGGRCFTKWPKKWRRTITVRYGAPLYHPQSVEEVQAVVGALKEAAANAAAASQTRAMDAAAREMNISKD